eukprot:NODE_1519_length_1139_cov_47.548624_g1237_i0.p1 GENE.NODE_1519_length_1139_cov_47.548624_g1237_i0~~NODE_1519_length_1139_cov_47.548624_g1237_i0.p1  ORF type:complete len:71 (-),score=7.01 NODE_1519_length_1139_cov_47.548624_g1237_i0:657-869(-)
MKPNESLSCPNLEEVSSFKPFISHDTPSVTKTVMNQCTQRCIFFKKEEFHDNRGKNEESTHLRFEFLVSL